MTIFITLISGIRMGGFQKWNPEIKTLRHLNELSLDNFYHLVFLKLLDEGGKRGFCRFFSRISGLFLGL